MRKSFKYLPYLYGTLLGWFLWHPPGWLDALGPLAWVVNGLIVMLLVVSVTPIIILANLPSDLKIEPREEAGVPPDVDEIRQQILALGFRSVGDPMTVHIAPPALLLGFVHSKEPVYASVYRTDTMPAKTSFDFVSILHGDAAGLTTGVDPEGAALDGGAGGLRQVLPGGSCAALFSTHLDGIRFLREKGLAVRSVSADSLMTDLKLGIRRQRDHFASRPVRSTWITFWRAATKRVPFLGPLRDQEIAQSQIVKIVSG